jgi:hypothetical protein
MNFWVTPSSGNDGLSIGWIWFVSPRPTGMSRIFRFLKPGAIAITWCAPSTPMFPMINS